MAIKAIVTDIEGTTSSLSFVKDVLFPYAREHLAEFVRQQGGKAEVRALLDEAQRLAGRKLTDEEIIAQLTAWIDEDRKITPLKTLQGMIWEEGYRLGHFQGHVYPDAVRHLQQWQRQGMRLYVYSSGSVQAQKLLFAHTEFGDLTPLFSGYFDTHVGGKRESQSYSTIALTIDLPPAEILFLSDIEEELDAARAAGLYTAWLVRPPAVPSLKASHPQARDFDAITL